MTSLPPPSPSWLPPIALGAMFTVLVQLASAVVGALVPQAQVGLCCCCAVETLPIGAVPAWLAARQDRRLRPAQGFAVAFIAAGLGSVVVAFVLFLQMRGMDTGEVRESVRAALEQANATSGTGALTREEIDRYAGAVVELFRFAPAIMATATTLLAAVVGMITVNVVRRRDQAGLAR